MDKVKVYVEANKDRFIKELFDLLRIPSISAQSEHRPDMQRCAEFLAAALVEAGADRAEVMPTAGNPVVYAEKIIDPKARTVLVYGHYDVMPVDPRGEWRTDPFEPVLRDGRIWGRGADDDKGQLWMHAKAFEAMCATDSLPCNVKFMLEGEEEIGSASLYDFCRTHRKLLKADIILVSDTSMLSMQTPSITCGLRGLAYMEVEVTGPDKDLHSGLFGGAVANPANVLTRLVAGLIEDGDHRLPVFDAARHTRPFVQHFVGPIPEKCFHAVQPVIASGGLTAHLFPNIRVKRHRPRNLIQHTVGRGHFLAHQCLPSKTGRGQRHALPVHHPHRVICQFGHLVVKQGDVVADKFMQSRVLLVIRAGSAVSGNPFGRFLFRDLGSPHGEHLRTVQYRRIAARIQHGDKGAQRFVLLKVGPQCGTRASSQRSTRIVMLVPRVRTTDDGDGGSHRRQSRPYSIFQFHLHFCIKRLLLSIFTQTSNTANGMRHQFDVIYHEASAVAGHPHGTDAQRVVTSRFGSDIAQLPSIGIAVITHPALAGGCARDNGTCQIAHVPAIRI